MIRRRAVRDRFGDVSYGRRRPILNTGEIRSEISTFRKIARLTKDLSLPKQNSEQEIETLLVEAGLPADSLNDKLIEISFKSSRSHR